MSYTEFDIGDRVYVTATYTDSAGEAVEPEGIKAWVRAPDGTVTELGVTLKANVAEADFLLTERGLWHYAFEWPEYEAAERTVKARERKVPR